MTCVSMQLSAKKPIFFFDEIQYIPNWEKLVNRVHEKGLKVFVTGSNAKLLSPEIATSLTGRNKTIRLLAFWDKADDKETLVIATHGFIKKVKKIPANEIDRAIRLKDKYFNNKQKK